MKNFQCFCQCWQEKKPRSAWLKKSYMGCILKSSTTNYTFLVGVKLLFMRVTSTCHCDVSWQTYSLYLFQTGIWIIWAVVLSYNNIEWVYFKVNERTFYTFIRRVSWFKVSLHPMNNFEIIRILKTWTICTIIRTIYHYLFE